MRSEWHGSGGMSAAGVAAAGRQAKQAGRQTRHAGMERGVALCSGPKGVDAFLYSGGIYPFKGTHYSLVEQKKKKGEDE